MTTPAAKATSATQTPRKSSPKPSTELATTDSGLTTAAGKISVDDSVVTKVAGLAAREVSGVHAMGVGTARALGAIRQRIPGSTDGGSATQGVRVEVGETQAAIDLDIVIEYGVSIADLGRSIQRNVKQSVERITGLEVVEVNVNVDDIWLGDDDGDTDDAPPRVQ